MSATQISFDEIERITQEAINRAGDHASTRWLMVAEDTVRRLAAWPHRAFTSCDVWAVLDGQECTTHEPRALGAVFRKLKAEGIIRPTGRYTKSTRSVAHGAPTLIWQGVEQQERIK